MRFRVLRALQRPALDLPLLAALLLLAAVGLTTLYSASGLDRHLVMNQGVRFVLGALAMLLIARVPPTVLRNWTPWLYVGSVLLLAVVAVLGQGRGAHRWLDLGFMRFQPSELVKLTLPMMAAWYLHARELPPRWTSLAALAVLIGAPALLIAKQPDLGTALLVVASGVFAVFLAGAWVQDHRGHVGIEALSSVLPPGVERFRLVLVDVMTFAFCAFFAWKSWTLFHEAWVDKMTTSSTFAPPLTIPYGLMALGMTLLVVQIALQIAYYFARRDTRASG